jgi:hypothetical protein
MSYFWMRGEAYAEFTLALQFTFSLTVRPRYVSLSAGPARLTIGRSRKAESKSGTLTGTPRRSQWDGRAYLKAAQIAAAYTLAVMGVDILF